MREAEKLFRALANGTRLKIIKILRQRPMSAIELSEQLRLSYKATHQHLSKLYSAGVLDRERASSLVYYRLASDLPKHIKVVLELVK